MSNNTQRLLIKIIKEWRENLDNIFFLGALLTDLSKAADCIPHDLSIAKLSAYGLSGNSLCYIYSSLKHRKQCVQINNKQGDFDTIMSGVSQSSIFGPILFSIFFSQWFFLIISKVFVHNFVHDKTMQFYKNTQRASYDFTIRMRNSNKLTLQQQNDSKSCKFQVFLLDKGISDNTNTEVETYFVSKASQSSY